jgi:hypothetical protein
MVSAVTRCLHCGERISYLYCCVCEAAPDGFGADPIAVEGDPLRDLRSMQRVVWVMKSGKAVRNDRR